MGLFTWLAVAALVVAVPFALIGFLHATRGTPIRRVRGSHRADGTPPMSDPRFCKTIELLTDTVLVPGHSVEILTCGDETYPRLWADLRSARESITLQMYYCKPGRVADEMKEIVCERARAGVKVLFLHDAFGSQSLPKEYFDQMKAAGAEVCAFRPLRWYDLHKAYARSHIRVVVVDGRIAYTGGFGLDDKWLGNGRVKGSWRDTNVRFTGPAVLQHQSTFADGWAEGAGVLLTGEPFFCLTEDGKEPEGEGSAIAGAMHASPTIGSTVAERLLALSIAGAQRTLYISNSYFVPDDDFRRMLKYAVERGVDVRILTAGKYNDVKSTWYAGRAKYEGLMTAGVRIYEYLPTMIHAKTLVVDRVWGSVGTMNFDNRSLAFNDETNLVCLDEAFGARLTEIFLQDLEYSREVTLDEFRRRPLPGRVAERAMDLVSRIL